MKNPIGILDSGIGGVTVLNEIIMLLPNEEYIYCSDSLNNPYGEKSVEQVFNYVDNIMKYFISKKCKAVVFACNTATALTIDKIREKYPDIIIVGIEPAYKMVYDYAKDKNTIVMATKGTTNSKRFQELYHHYDNGKTILVICHELANLIEEGKDREIDEYLIKTLPTNKKIEAVVLGCTHYPLIKDKIIKVLGNVSFYDGANGVANRLYHLLEDNNLINNNSNGKITFIDSSSSIKKENRFWDLLSKN